MRVLHSVQRIELSPALRIRHWVDHEVSRCLQKMQLKIVFLSRVRIGPPLSGEMQDT